MLALYRQGRQAEALRAYDAMRKRLAERDIGLEVANDAMDLLADAGFDPVYGARPLKRAIQQRLENPLAEAILRGDFVPGDSVAVQLEGDSLGFAKSTSAAA